MSLIFRYQNGDVAEIVLSCELCPSYATVIIGDKAYCKFHAEQKRVPEGATVAHKEWCLVGDGDPCDCGAANTPRQ